ncbi:MAG: type II toxin-antitoxin system Phd/YefM family antitoxin [Chloroflexi bacterium]|nr:type II toxin-antitoxin system Phd/YefM family antitoxin [Chloroflexota bacterium]
MQEFVRNTVSATQARLRFNEIIKKASTEPKPIFVEKAGAPTVVILSLSQYEELIREARIGRFVRLSRVAGIDAERQGLTEEWLEEEMAQVRDRVYQRHYG